MRIREETKCCQRKHRKGGRGGGSKNLGRDRAGEDDELVRRRLGGELQKNEEEQEEQELGRLLSNGLCRAANQGTIAPIPRNSSSFHQNLPGRRRPHIKLLENFI